MLRRALSAAALLALLMPGCAEVPPPAPAAPPPVAAAPAASPPASPKASPPRFIEDDLPGAAAKARAEGKALFVDAWAPWCHSCLSMKQYVLSDPALGALSDRVVFVSIDTDRPESAAFLEHHAMKAWPTFFVLDPRSDKVLGYWSGSGSVSEMRSLVEEGLHVMAGDGLGPAARAFAEARAAHAAGDLVRAERRYREAVASATADWPDRSAALLGWIQALHGAGAWEKCNIVATTFLHAIEGSAMPADASGYLLDCADHLASEADKADARQEAVARLRQVTAPDRPGMTADDRADALGLLAEGLEALGDAAGAKKAQEDRLAVLEKAAAAAKTPEEAHTFDYARAGAYVALGRAGEAIRMLEQRERELPDSYEPPARLADVLFKAGRLPEALAAADRAIGHSYGPRRLRYLKLRSDILRKQGDAAGELAALRDEAKGYESLPPGQSSPEKLADARKRLADAEGRSASPPPTPSPGPKSKAKPASVGKGRIGF
jgi:tetratricopeptide (TPR) repeat protein/thiol-disulfide isomerase/thioredoxin